MPYAAVRRPAAMLPFNVQLDDLQSMSEGRSLSAAEEFEILVRVSKQGIAQANTDDWVWRSAVMTQQDLQNGSTVKDLAAELTDRCKLGCGQAIPIKLLPNVDGSIRLILEGARSARTHNRAGWDDRSLSPLGVL